MAVCVRQGFQLVVGGLHILMAVTLAEPALGIGVLNGEAAGPVEVEVGR
jgi:hypothetical protein